MVSQSRDPAGRARLMLVAIVRCCYDRVTNSFAANAATGSGVADRYP